MPNSLQPNVTTPLLEADELEELLNYLKQVRQVDLTGYKRPSLERRMQVRMQQLGVEHYHDYLDHLQQQPDEVAHLLDTVFINFTSFFRDRSVWDYLEHQIIPKIIASKAPDEPIRVWSAGCASGQETYSLAMLFAEVLGIEQFQQRVHIYGTDVDSNAVMQARQGKYPADAVEAIPAALQERYFERKNHSYCWRPDLRRSINFHLHNLIQDPPLPRIDLLVCRNTFLYFTLDTQLRVLVRFHFSLKQNGFLLLGTAESMVTPLQSSLFTPVERQTKLFTKIPNAHRSSRLLSIAFRP